MQTFPQIFFKFSSNFHPNYEINHLLRRPNTKLYLFQNGNEEKSIILLESTLAYNRIEEVPKLSINRQQRDTRIRNDLLQLYPSFYLMIFVLFQESKKKKKIIIIITFKQTVISLTSRPEVRPPLTV